MVAGQLRFWLRMNRNQKTDLDYLFEPENVAVIGASREPGRPGFTILRNLKEWGFKGKVFPINPNASEILGFKAYPRIDLVPDEIETVIIATPAPIVPEVMKECVQKAVKAAIIISGGFSEEGREQLEAEVTRIAREGGIRFVGPNTSGIMNTSANFTSAFGPVQTVPEGGIAFIAQTGQFAGVLAEQITSSLHIGLSKVVGLGNKSDVDEAEVLDYLRDDVKTRVIAVYLEGVKDGRRFVAAAQKTTRVKPILIFKGGTTEAGSRMAMSHTASLAGREDIFSAACRQAGIIQTETFEELVDLSMAFSLLPLPKGGNVGILSGTGAVCVMLADLAYNAGLQIVSLSPQTIETLRGIAPEWHNLSNPVDLSPGIEKISLSRGYTMAIEALRSDKKVDSLIVHFSVFKGRGIPTFSGQRGEKPIVFSISGTKETRESLAEQLIKGGFPAYFSFRTAVRAISVMTAYAKYISQLSK
jgi:acyl-CoA synthetase (NDP forming)